MLRFDMSLVEQTVYLVFNFLNPMRLFPQCEKSERKINFPVWRS